MIGLYLFGIAAGILMALIFKNEKSQVLVRYVIQMCRTLNQMIPIAEGIETEGQINILKNLGCDFGQGYYFSKPISVKDFFNRYMEAEVKAN